MATAKSKQSTARSLSVDIALPLAATTVHTPVLINSGVSLEEKVAMRISSIEYTLEKAFWRDALVDLATDVDVTFGFTFLSAQPAAGNRNTTPGVIDYVNLVASRNSLTAVGFEAYGLSHLSIMRDMRIRHSEGVLVHPANFFAYANNLGPALSAATTIHAVVYYTMEEITQEVWDDLWKQIFVTQV